MRLFAQINLSNNCPEICPEIDFWTRLGLSNNSCPEIPPKGGDICWTWTLYGLRSMPPSLSSNSFVGQAIKEALEERPTMKEPKNETLHWN
jgi:hypothetical protein